MSEDRGTRTVLVTGASGFIGSHLAERLLTEDLRVRCLVRRSSALRYVPVSRVEVRYGDLATGAGLAEALDGVDLVFHLAGVTKALRSQEFYLGNARATGNLVRACAGRRMRFVHVSTLAAMGPSVDGQPVGEDAEPRPLTHYGRSKLEAEQAVRGVLPDAVIVRPPVVYGPRDTDVWQVLLSIRKGVMLSIGRGEAWFSIVYVKDLVEGLVAAARSHRAAGRSYFMAQAKPVSWREFGETAADVLGRRARVLAIPRRAAYLAAWSAELWAQLRRKPGILSRDKVREACCRYWICSTNRAEEELGFRATTALRDGLAETVTWYREAGWLK